MLYNTTYKKYVKPHSKNKIQESRVFGAVTGSRDCGAVNTTNPQNFL